MNRAATAIWVGAAAVLALALVFLASGTRTGARRFDKEPTVHLVVDETGESRWIPMEEYIMGVVGGEMGRFPTDGGGARDWPREAYAAQAILARSFALNFLDEQGRVNISNDVLEAQAYQPQNVTQAIREAVEGTRGQVMVHQGRFVKAWFHSYSGGHTATAKEGLNYQDEEPGFIQPVKLPENEFVPDEYRAWTASFPLSEVSEALVELADVGPVTDLEIVERGPSGRATTIRVRGARGTGEVHAADLRIALDPERMRSTLLEEFEVRDGRLVMSGYGFGHGVGLSQWDAYKMAREGKGAGEILKTFFKDIEIEKVWQ